MTKTTQEWLEIFEGSGMPYAAINDIKQTLEHDHGEWLACGPELLSGAVADVFEQRKHGIWCWKSITRLAGQ